VTLGLFSAAKWIEVYQELDIDFSNELHGLWPIWKFELNAAGAAVFSSCMEMGSSQRLLSWRLFRE